MSEHMRKDDTPLSQEQATEFLNGVRGRPRTDSWQANLGIEDEDREYGGHFKGGNSALRAAEVYLPNANDQIDEPTDSPE